MIKAFQLLFDPSLTWERIDKEQSSTLQVFITFLLPWLLTSVLVESASLLIFGRIGPLDSLIKVPLPLVIRYAVVRILLDLALVFGGALLLTRVASSFHSRQNFPACFTTLAYSLSPLFMVRFFDAWPAINTWLCYAVGVLLTVSFLYRGIPRTLKPEPSNALGMYLFASVFILIASGLAHYIGTLILNETIMA